MEDNDKLLQDRRHHLWIHENVSATTRPAPDCLLGLLLLPSAHEEGVLKVEEEIQRRRR
jgi:hypothetical protein